jgi:hypothetical protein
MAESATGNVGPTKISHVFRSGSINFYHREMALFITESHAGLADHGIDRLLRKVSSAFRVKDHISCGSPPDWPGVLGTFAAPTNTLMKSSYALSLK